MIRNGSYDNKNLIYNIFDIICFKKDSDQQVDLIFDTRLEILLEIK